jgi:3,5-dihydroxyphenylacetyl-CoA synthase
VLDSQEAGAGRNRSRTAAVGAPRILATGTAIPSTRLDQEAVLSLFGYADPLRRNFFMESGIESRHFFVDPTQPRLDEDLDQLATRFREGSVRLGTQAARACLSRAGLDVVEVDFLATTTCTGRLCPSLDAHLIRALGLREDVQRVHVGDTGCAAAMVALQQAYNHLQAFPGHRALVVAIEVCSTTYTVDDDPQTAVANAIFGDGAAAVLLGTEGNGTKIVAHQSLIRSEYLDQMGFTFPGGRHRVRLSKDIRRIAPKMMAELATRLLSGHGLTPQDVRYWVLHSAGRRVLERAQTELGLSGDALAFSRAVLRRFGNMSSATVLFVLDHVLSAGDPRSGDWGIMIALGPGFAAEGAVLGW